MNQTEQTSRVVVLLFTDIVDSVDMHQRLGTQTYTEILQQHDELFREYLGSSFGEGVTGDEGEALGLGLD